MYKIIENALAPYNKTKIQKALESDSFQWFYNDRQLLNDNGEPDSPMLFHLFFDIDTGINSEHFDVLVPLFDKLRVKELINVRANLTMNSYGNTFNHPHIDTWYDEGKRITDHKTAVFYVNENNGGTNLCGLGEDGKDIFVQSKSNRCVVFDADHLHHAVHQTDTNRRIVVNVNYYEL